MVEDLHPMMGVKYVTLAITEGSKIIYCKKIVNDKDWTLQTSLSESVIELTCGLILHCGTSAERTYCPINVARLSPNLTDM